MTYYEPPIKFEVVYPKKVLTRLELTKLALPEGIELEECSICGWTAPMIHYGFDGKELLMDIYCEKCNNGSGWHAWKKSIEYWNEREEK